MTTRRTFLSSATISMAAGPLNVATVHVPPGAARPKQYRLNFIEGPVELISLLGDIALHDGNPTVHAHLSVGHPDGKQEGGHLINAYVFPTPLYKKDDSETDLNLIDLVADY